MSWLFDSIAELLVNSIMATLGSIFGGINDVVNDAALEVGVTPGTWNPGVFSMVENLSNTVILPIAGIILTCVVSYELIHLIIDRNNMSDDVLCKRGISSAYNNANGSQLTYGKASWQPTRKVVLYKVPCTHGV